MERKSEQEICVENMNKIYLLVGQFVEAAQMLEGVFQIFNAEQFLLDSDYDETAETINGLTIEEFFLNNPNNDFIKSFKMGLGTGVSKVKDTNKFSTDLLKGILKITSERNTIIHSYFRTTDYYTNWNNEAFFKLKIDWLTSRVKKARNICDELRKIHGNTLWEDRWDKSLGDHKPVEARV